MSKGWHNHTKGIYKSFLTSSRKSLSLVSFFCLHPCLCFPNSDTSFTLDRQYDGLRKKRSVLLPQCDLFSLSVPLTSNQTHIKLSKMHTSELFVEYVCFMFVLFFKALLTCGVYYLLYDAFCHLGTMLNEICKLILSWGFTLCVQKA